MGRSFDVDRGGMVAEIVGASDGAKGARQAGSSGAPDSGRRSEAMAVSAAQSPIASMTRAE